MLRIGELAALTGVTTRTVRHYHAVGLLPEPVRRANGYRAYDLRAAVRLLRIRRLTELGLSLPEVRVALAGDPELDLPEILAELDADLAREEEAIRQRRARLHEPRARTGDLTVPGEVADLLAGLAAGLPGAVPDASLTDPLISSLLDREREVLELLEGTRPEAFAAAAEQYRRALADPELLARTGELMRRFAAPAEAEPTDPDVAALADELAAGALGSFGVDGAAPIQPYDEAVWQGYLADFAPAQRRCLELVERACTQRQQQR